MILFVLRCVVASASESVGYLSLKVLIDGASEVRVLRENVYIYCIYCIDQLMYPAIRVSVKWLCGLCFFEGIELGSLLC